MEGRAGGWVLRLAVVGWWSSREGRGAGRGVVGRGRGEGAELVKEEGRSRITCIHCSALSMLKTTTWSTAITNGPQSRPTSLSAPRRALLLCSLKSSTSPPRRGRLLYSSTRRAQPRATSTRRALLDALDALRFASRASPVAPPRPSPLLPPQQNREQITQPKIRPVRLHKVHLRPLVRLPEHKV